MQNNINMATMPLGRHHVWVVFVASLGQLIGTGVATLAGIIIPLLNIISHPELSSAMQGIIGAMDLIGISIGSVFFGKLIDRYGYILFFRICPAIVLAFALVSILFPSIPVLIVCLFFIGFGIGGEYCLDSNYISELMPVKWKSLMIGVAKTASAFGNIIVAAICFLILKDWKTGYEWSHLMWIIAVISFFMLFCRIWFYQSPKWLLEHGHTLAAEEAAKKFLGKDVIIEPSSNSLTPVSNEVKNKVNTNFFISNWKKVILTGIPWACEGLGVYGIGVFLPVLIMSLGIEHSSSGELAVAHVDSSVLITFFISCIILPGFLLGLWLIIKKCNLCKMQSWGFILCAASLIILLIASLGNWPKWISIVAFMAFELFLNMGPHLITFILPPKVYPVATRGFGSGIAASLGKIGAVLGVFFIPVILHSGGIIWVLGVSAFVMLLGAVITAIFHKSVSS